MSAAVNLQAPIVALPTLQRRLPQIEALDLLDAAIALCAEVGAISASQSMRMHRVLRESQPWNAGEQQ